MKNIAEFAAKYFDYDTTRLILDKNRYPDIDMETVVACIESRRKLKGKVQEWYLDQRLVFPAKLSAEQCSSSATASYKADLAERITGRPKGEWKIADLTGGMGIDSWFFSKKAAKVLYNEMQLKLCKAAEYNFSILEALNIEISNHRIDPVTSADPLSATPKEVLKGFAPDIIFLDPARRGEDGKKVFLIEECTPDVLSLKADLHDICRHILIKLSPMADISMVCNRLGETCREVHVVASEGECKELLIWMDREWKGEYRITAVELRGNGMASPIAFLPSEEKSQTRLWAHKGLLDSTADRFLFIPGKSLTKSGAFNLISERFGIYKMGASTHAYITEDISKTGMLMEFGKVYRINQILPLDKKSIRSTGKEYPRAEVTARNIPMDSDTLRKKLGVTSGDDAHIFGLKSDCAGNLLIITDKVLSSDELA